MKTSLRSIVYALVALLVAQVPEARAAAFIKLGDIEGEATDSNHKDWIIIESMSADIIPERDAATGLPTGKRQHKPLKITKEIDKASPLIAQSLTLGRLIPTARIEFVRTGDQDRYYQVFLKNVLITSQQTGGADGRVPTESFSLNYEEIKWTVTVWDDTDIVHVLKDHSYRWNLIHEAGESDTLPAGSFRLRYGASPGGTGNVLKIEWEGFEEFRYFIKAGPSPDGRTHATLETHLPIADGMQEVELPIGTANQFFQIEKVRESILQQ